MEEANVKNVYVGGNRKNSLINQKMICRILGFLLFIEGVMLLVCAGVSLFYHESDYIYFVYSTLITVGAGGLLVFLGRKAENKLTRRDGYCIVAFTWILFSAFGMLPFLISGAIPSVADAFFEIVSGFTTTGATILDNIESLSHGILFWRSFSHWIGGLGIVFFTIAVLPIFGVGNQVLFSAEATGVTHDKIHPKVSIMAKWLWTVYLILTVSETLLLVWGGMGWFDAVCHSFSTTATGGFSTKQSSVAYWNSPFIEYTIAIFMMLSSLNFSLYFMCLKGKFRHLWKDDEVRGFFISVFTVTLIIMVSLIAYNHYDIEKAFRKALFQVVTVHSSTGFTTDDYNYWMPFTWMLIVYATVVGGCTGSTSGGIKVMRLLILLRNAKNELARLIHPRAVFPVKINRQMVDPMTISAVTTFTLLFLICGFVGWIILMMMGVELTDALGVVYSSLGNAGVALGNYGPAFSWSGLPDGAKWILSFLMLLGRLELYAILLMFVPSFWHNR